MTERKGLYVLASSTQGGQAGCLHVGPHVWTSCVDVAGSLQGLWCTKAPRRHEQLLCIVHVHLRDHRATAGHTSSATAALDACGKRSKTVGAMLCLVGPSEDHASAKSGIDIWALLLSKLLLVEICYHRGQVHDIALYIRRLLPVAVMVVVIGAGKLFEGARNHLL